MRGYHAVLIVVGVLILSGTAFAETPEEIQRKIAAQNEQILLLEREIAQYERELTGISQEKRTLEGAVKELDLSRKKVTATISVEEKKITQTQEHIAELDADIRTKESSLEQQRRALASTLRRIDATENQTFAEALLGSGSLGDVWEHMDTDAQFQAAVRTSTEELSATKASLENTLKRSTEKRAELLSRKQNLVAQKQALDVTKKEKSSLLSTTKEKEGTYQRLLEDKRAAKEAFEQALLELQSELAYTVDPSSVPPAGKGVLRWPLENVRITQKFGNTEFARSGAYNGKGHNGIDFGASVGTSVKAALSGTIVATGNTDAYKGCYSYGKWVLVRHGNGLSTLYAHLSSILVSPNDAVATGDIIGLSGNTGYSTGPHLHFTVFVSEAVQVRKLGELRTKTSCAQAPMPISPLEGYLNPLEYL